MEALTEMKMHAYNASPTDVPLGRAPTGAVFADEATLLVLARRVGFATYYTQAFVSVYHHAAPSHFAVSKSIALAAVDKSLSPAA